MISILIGLSEEVSIYVAIIPVIVWISLFMFVKLFKVFSQFKLTLLNYFAELSVLVGLIFMIILHSYNTSGYVT